MYAQIKITNQRVCLQYSLFDLPQEVLPRRNSCHRLSKPKELLRQFSWRNRTNTAPKISHTFMKMTTSHFKRPNVQLSMASFVLRIRGRAKPQRNFYASHFFRVPQNTHGERLLSTRELYSPQKLLRQPISEVELRDSLPGWDEKNIERYSQLALKKITFDQHCSPPSRV